MKNKTFTDDLIDLVNRCGLSRFEIARRSGVSEAALSRFVRGQRGLTTTSIDRIGPVIGLKFSSIKIKAKRANFKG